jgi:hypothetical protein
MGVRRVGRVDVWFVSWFMPCLWLPVITESISVCAIHLIRHNFVCVIHFLCNYWINLCVCDPFN